MTRIRLYDEEYPTTNILDIDVNSVEEGILELIFATIGATYIDADLTYFDGEVRENLLSRSKLDEIDLDPETNLEAFIGEVEAIKELCDKHNAAYFRFIN